MIFSVSASPARHIEAFGHSIFINNPSAIMSNHEEEEKEGIHATTTAAPSDSTNNLSHVSPITINPDGSITRNELPNAPASPDPNSPSPVLSKDVPLNPQHHTWVRLYLPRQPLNTSSAAAKPPLIVYIHGGGFIIGSAATVYFHNFCVEMAAQLGAMVASVDYRLAPEHRLPAAYDDAMDALYWISTSEDEWLRDFADLSNCYLMGVSAGGNIVYHAGLRAAAAADDLLPLKIKGLVLDQPGFYGSERTGSELRLPNDPVLPQELLDLIWKLSLPIGANFDHEYSNPMVGSESETLERVKSLGWRVMVIGSGGDPLFDRQMGLAKMLEKQGVQVVGQFEEGGCHAGELREPTRATALYAAIKSFLNFCP